MSKKRNFIIRGFTLVEMMISIAIFTMITGIVIFNHGKFNSAIVVTNLAYEVALAVREAQVYGLAVKQDDPNTSTEYAYGVHFDTTSDENKKVMYIFADKNDNQQFEYNPSNGCDGGLLTECQEKIEIRGDVEISSLKTAASNDNNYDTRDELTILFLRPNPVAIIRDGDNPEMTTNGRQRAIIELQSTKAEKSKEILVELSGQISVQDKI
jgi:prepilin-type N-terminal cleavage/methylation domain-containing protein